MNESASPALVPLRQSWPPALVARYRAAGYWRGETLPGVLRERATRFADDIAVVGCGDLPESATELISLSTITEPRKEIGRLAADYLLKQITEPATKGDADAVLCRGEVIERGSTAERGTK